MHQDWPGRAGRRGGADLQPGAGAPACRRRQALPFQPAVGDGCTILHDKYDCRARSVDAGTAKLAHCNTRVARPSVRLGACGTDAVPKHKGLGWARLLPSSLQKCTLAAGHNMLQQGTGRCRHSVPAPCKRAGSARIPQADRKGRRRPGARPLWAAQFRSAGEYWLRSTLGRARNQSTDVGVRASWTGAARTRAATRHVARAA